LPDSPQNAARQATFEIGLVRERYRTGKGDAAVGGRDVRGTESAELGCERWFEPARARRKKMLGHRSGAAKIKTA
jgi:hypothetical protein